MDSRTKLRILTCFLAFMFRDLVFMFMVYCILVLTYGMGTRRRNRRRKKWSMISKMPDQYKHLSELVEVNDQACIHNLRMDRNSFFRLCYLLEHMGGLRNERYFSQTLDAILKLGRLLLVDLEPVGDDCTSETWACFQGCLGALDGTYIEVRVPKNDQTQYRCRKGHTAVNVLGVCNREMNFIYVLAGWEGSVADSRVLRDALHRLHSLRVPTGHYYLCDAGYANAEGFLAPYRGTRYHLRDWQNGPNTPQNVKEYFNLKHSKARSIIERAFALLKGRWAILRSPNFYPIKKQNYIILARALLHNFIRSSMAHDPLEDIDLVQPSMDVENRVDVIETIESSSDWSLWRDNLARNMYHAWRAQ